jgi:glycerol-3-phosphate dehydrogenase
MSRPAPADRSAIIERLTGEPLDVLVAGGGIVGSGIARDAAMRGLRVGLVEQHDFAYGTSSRSGRMLHGGLRYLAQLRIGLVREASVEKRIVHRIAPHLCMPLALVFPAYRAAPWAKWALWKLRVGVRLYDLLCGGQNLGRSSSLSAGRLAEVVSGVCQAGLKGGVRYYDGLTNDARLVIDTLRSAEAAGATLANYCKLVEAHSKSAVWRCVVNDRLTGRSHELAARCVINATGPWAEQFEASSIRLRPTKGVHLVIDRARLPVEDGVVMLAGGRILFAVPWGRRVILGTTDTDYAGEPEAVRVEPADVEYILGIINATFPAAGLCQADMVSAWAGLRPLVARGRGRPSDIPRGHKISNPRPGWWDVAGGKLTTYRLMAEQTVDRVERYLGRRVGPCQTAERPLLPPEQVEGVSGILPPEVTREAVEHYCTREWAVQLEDVMVRRAGWHHYHRDAGEIARQVAEWMAEILGWDEAEKGRQEESLARLRSGNSS